MSRSWPTKLGSYALNASVILILVVLILPTFIVIPISFSDTDYIVFPPRGLSWRWYEEFFADEDWLRAALFSIRIGVLTTFVAVTIGTMAALAIIRGRLPAIGVMSTLVLAPLIVPNITSAIAIYLQFSHWHLSGTTLGFVLAHTVLAVPYVFIVVSSGLQRLDPSVEMAALSLGAARWRTLFEVTLPLIRPSVAAAAVFAFLASFDETVVSFFISDAETKTLTRKIFEDIDFNLSPIVAAVSTLIVICTLVLMVLPRLLTEKGRSAA
jgi:mannopine transport system permease protein